jgi:hypothetical protein
LRCGFDLQLPADAAKVALDSSRVIVQVLCDGFEGAQFHEGMQYLLLRRCEQSFFHNNQIRIRCWWLFDAKKLWRENLLDKRCSQRIATKNDDGKLLLCYSPRLEPFVFHRLHSPRHRRRLHPRDEAFGDIVTELFFVKLPLALMVGGTIWAVTQHEGVGH